MASRRWCFTLNNPTQEEENNLSNVATHSSVIYMTYQAEIGEKGTRHLQGYVELPRKRRLKGVLKILGERMHLEAAKGTPDECIAYCQKDDTRDTVNPRSFVFGECVTQGQRTDLDALHAALKEGKTDEECWELFFGVMLRYHRGVASYQRQRLTDRTEPPQVVIIYGPPGCGKTRQAYDLAAKNGLTVYKPVTPNGSKSLWWDGYCQQDIILLDDFYGWMQWTTLLQLLDRWPVSVQIKGGSVPVNSPLIYLTSNVSPEYWYKPDGKEFGALLRRCSQIISMTADGSTTQMKSKLSGWAKPPEVMYALQ